MDLPIVELARSISSGEITASSVTATCLASIKASKTNSVVVINPNALADAQALDAKSEEAKAMLHLPGVPFTIKLHIDVAGLPSSDGLRQYIPKTNAPVVEAIINSGGIILGKTNIPVNCADYQSYNPCFGVTLNPLDHKLSPGGSSGGSAAAVAEQLTSCCLGTDIGGSVRVPASFCGVFSHKPSWGLISKGQSGTKNAPKDLSTTGPIARHSADLETVFEVLIMTKGREEFSGLRNAIVPPSKISTLVGVKVAVWSDDSACPVDKRVLAAMDATVALLADEGAIITHAKPSFDSEEMLHTYRVAVAAAMAGEVSPETRAELLAEAANPAVSNDEASWMTASHHDWLANERQRAEVRAAYAALFEDYDILLTPVFPTCAFPHDRSEAIQPFWRKSSRKLSVTRPDGEETYLPYWRGCFWPTVANLPLLPATSFPVYLADNGMPVGIQAVGPELADRTTMAFVQLIEKAGADNIAQYKTKKKK